MLPEVRCRPTLIRSSLSVKDIIQIGLTGYVLHIKTWHMKASFGVFPQTLIIPQKGLKSTRTRQQRWRRRRFDAAAVASNYRDLVNF